MLKYNTEEKTLTIVLETENPEQLARDIQGALIDAMQKYPTDEHTDPKQLGETNYYLLEVIKAMGSVAYVELG